MRWFVEVSRVGELESDENYCVEAKQWQAALQEARRLRGDSGPLSKFSIELLDDGYRAVDPRLKVRYLVHQAPLDAPLTPVPDFAPPTRGYVNGQSTAPARSSSSPSLVVPAPADDPPAPRPESGHVPARAVPSRLPPLDLAVDALEPTPAASASSLPPRPAKAAEASVLRAPVGLVAATDAVPRAPSLPRGLGTDGNALPAAVAGLAALASQPKRTPSQAPPPPAATVLRRRGEEPTPASPITYREVAYQVAPGVTRAEVEALLTASLRELQQQLATRPSQKFVQLAVFDHKFERRPERPALGTLRWKDWRGEPVLSFPQFDGPSLPSASSPPPSFGPPPSVSPPAAAAPEPAAPEPAAPAKSPSGRPLKPSVPVVIRERAVSVEPPPPSTPEAAAAPESVPFPLRSLAPGADASRLVAGPPTPARADELGDAAPSVVPPPAASVAPALASVPEAELAPAALAPADSVPAASIAPALASVPEAESEPAALAPADTAPAASIAPPPISPPEIKSAPGASVAPPPISAPEIRSAPASLGPAASDPAPSLTPTVASSPEVAGAPPTPELRTEAKRSSEPGPSLPHSLTPVPPSRDRGSRPRLIVARRRVGEDLISELFETMHDLHFMPDLAAGTDFALAALESVLPAEGVLIHAFDINSRQFVVVRAHGPSAPRALLHRSADSDLPFSFVMRRPGSIVIDDTGRDGRALGPRWDLLGVAPRALLLAPVRKAGRYLGLIEVANPLGDAPFHPSEQNAVDYVSEQLAEFLANRPLVFEPEVILRP